MQPQATTIRQALHAAAAYFQAGRLQDAEALARQVVAQDPRNVEALNLLGSIAHRAGRNEIAIECFTRAIQIDPRHGLLYCNLGESLRLTGRNDEAIQAFGAAIERAPRDPVARNCLGVALCNAGKLDDAIAVWRELVEIAPTFALACHNLANALLERGAAREAAEWHRRAIALDPKLIEAHSNLLRELAYLPEITPQQLLDEHRQWWARHGKPIAEKSRAAHDNDRDPDRALRIGWLSPDFREHSVAYFLEPIFTNHDRSRMQFICYSMTPAVIARSAAPLGGDAARADPFTGRFKSLADAWRDIAGASDEQALQQMRDDRIDILIDLAGHTPRNRMTLLAHKPAPIQVNYLGYPCTTGAGSVDYRLTDALADPPGLTEAHHVEKLVRLPRTAWCYHPPADAPPVEPLPAERIGRITFGSFNSLAKINERVVELWSRILRQVSNSRLLLKGSGLGEESVQTRIAGMFAAHNIGRERLELMGRTPTTHEHLRQYAHVDIALDTFPYNGTTTTCESLWMGVPVVALEGDRHMSRVGVSLLTSSALPELIARDPEDYVRIATALAQDLPRLRELRATLRQRMSDSPLRDERTFTRGLESVLRELWHVYTAEKRFDSD